MKKIFFLLLLLPFFVDAQLPQELKTWGFKTRRIFPDTLQGLPADTFSVPSAYRTLPFLAAKHDTLYIWNLTYWKLFSGGGEATTASNALTLVGSDVRLGGDMTGNTTISMHNNRILTFDSVSQFLVKRSGITRLNVSTGNTQLFSPTGAYSLSISSGNTLLTGNTIDLISSWTDLSGGQGQIGMLDSIYERPYLGAKNIDSLRTPTVEGHLMVWGGNGNGRVAALAPGTSGYVLTTQGNSLPPVWVAPSTIVQPENGTQLVGGKIHLGGAMTKSDTLTQGIYPTSNYNLVFTKDISAYSATYPTTTNIISSAGWTQRSIDGGNIIINYQDSAAASGDNYPGLYLQSGFNSTTALAFGVHNQPADHHGFIDLRAASNLTSFGIEYNGISWLLLKTNGLMYMGHAVGAKRLRLGGSSDPGQTLSITGSISASDSAILSSIVRLTDTTGFDVVMRDRTTGNLKMMYPGLLGGGSSGLTVGTTAIASGTTTRILYDNAGVLGEYTLTGSGTVVAMQTAPSFVTSITSPIVYGSASADGTLIHIGNSAGAGNTATVANQIFKVGNTPTQAMDILNNGVVRIGAAPNTTSGYGLVVDQPDDGTDLKAAKFSSNNHTAYVEFGYDRIQGSGALKVGTNSTGLQLYGPAGTSVSISSSATTATSSLYLDGSFGPKLSTSAIDVTLTNVMFTMILTATGKTATLPTAVGITNRIYIVKLSASGTGTVATTSSQTIDGATTYSLSAQYKFVVVQSDGANWHIIGNN